MPPIEPSQTPTTPSSQQAPSNIPEYLHMEPIPDPAIGQAKKRKKKIIIVIAVLVTVLIAGVVAGIVWVMGAPERQFYTMLDNMMNMNNVSREFTSGSTFAALVESDTTKPATQISFDAKVQKQETRGDIVTVNSDYFTARLAKTSTKELPNNASINTWYKVAEPTAASVSKTSVVMDPFNLRVVLNPLFDNVIIGHFDQATRQQTIDFMKTNKVYAIKSYKADKLNGQDVSVYTVDINNAKQRKTQVEKLATAAHVSSSGFNPVNGTFTFWVDNKTNRLLQIASTTAKSTTTETLQYPSNITVTEPTGAKQLD
jgi:hypothetical protein